MGTVTGLWEHTLMCVFFSLPSDFFCLFYLPFLLIYLELRMLSSQPYSLSYGLSSWLTKNSTQSAVLAVFYCPTAKGENPITHKALEALPERRICISAMGFNGNLVVLTLECCRESCNFLASGRKICFGTLICFSAIPEESW